MLSTERKNLTEDQIMFARNDDTSGLSLLDVIKWVAPCTRAYAHARARTTPSERIHRVGQQGLVCAAGGWVAQGGKAYNIDGHDCRQGLIQRINNQRDGSPAGPAYYIPVVQSNQ